MNLVDLRVQELISNGVLEPNDELFHFFKNIILPNVVYEWITPSGINSHSFKCPFQICRSLSLFVSSQSLERHLREQHFDQIPNGVFGQIKSFDCNVCCTTFKRNEHLSRHLDGRKHLKMLIKKGLASKEQLKFWQNICEAESEQLKLAEEDDLTSFFIADTTTQTSIDDSSYKSSFVSLNTSLKSTSSQRSYSPCLSLGTTQYKFCSSPLEASLENLFDDHSEIIYSNHLETSQDYILKEDNSEDEFFQDPIFIKMITDIENDYINLDRNKIKNEELKLKIENTFSIDQSKTETNCFKNESSTKRCLEEDENGYKNEKWNNLNENGLNDSIEIIFSKKQKLETVEID